MAKCKRRTFTPEFKAEVVLEALSGQSSQAELCRCHNLSEDQLSKWKQQFLENAVSLFECSGKQSDASLERIAQLEQCDLIILAFLGGIRSGLVILPMFDSRDTSSMLPFSWMFSREA